GKDYRREPSTRVMNRGLEGPLSWTLGQRACRWTSCARTSERETGTGPGAVGLRKAGWWALTACSCPPASSFLQHLRQVRKASAAWIVHIVRLLLRAGLDPELISSVRRRARV